MYQKVNDFFFNLLSCAMHGLSWLCMVIVEFFNVIKYFLKYLNNLEYIILIVLRLKQ